MHSKLCLLYKQIHKITFTNYSSKRIFLLMKIPTEGGLFCHDGTHMSHILYYIFFSSEDLSEFEKLQLHSQPALVQNYKGWLSKMLCKQLTIILH